MRRGALGADVPGQLEAAFAACPLVYFTYGLCEPHGPQNAVGLDSLKAHAIACRAAEAHGGIVAPPDYWHIHELGGYAAWAERAVGAGRADLADGGPALDPLQATSATRSGRPTRSASRPRSC